MGKTYKIKYIYKKLKLKIIKAIYTTELKPKKRNHYNFHPQICTKRYRSRDVYNDLGY